MKGEVLEVLQLNETKFHKFTHELKNPLTVCKGYLEMLGISDESTKEKYISIIKEEIKRSLNIISNYSKEKLELEEMDLVMLLEDVKDILNDLFEKNNSKIILLTKEELYIKGNYDKLKQVLINILKNSYEAKTNEKLLVVIKVLELDNTYKISITDNGIGMNQLELKNIDNEYFTTKKNGNGLGVPTIKEIIMNHGGKIIYRSKKNRGTRVNIFLPKEKSPKTFNSSNYYC